MSRSTSAPRLLLSARSLSGVSLAPRERLLDVAARFREPESLAVTLSKAVDAGIDGVLVSPTPALAAALTALRRPVPLYAVVPALSEHERQELEPAIEPLIARGRRRSDVGARLRVGWREFTHPAWLQGADFAARMPVLIEAELAPVPRREIRGVVIDAWLTDPALAAGNRTFFERTIAFVRRRYRAAAGFETHNLGLMLARLREWKVNPDFVVGPFNPCGLLMKPTARDVMDEMSKTEVAVVAAELRGGEAATLEQGALFARGYGAYGLAPDLAELEDVTSELKALARGGTPEPIRQAS